MLKTKSSVNIADDVFTEMAKSLNFQLIPVHQSGGGMAGDGAQSYAATVISAAKVHCFQDLHPFVCP